MGAELSPRRLTRPTAAARTITGELAASLARITTARLRSETRVVDEAFKRLALVGPANTLKRGYALLRLPNGEQVRTVGQLDAGATVEITLVDGRAAATIDQVDAETPPYQDPSAKQE